MTKLISIVTPFYNEEESIHEYFSQLNDILSKIEGITYEFIAVDDGSSDKSYDILKQLSKNNPITIVKLSRNFGKEIALTAGIDHAHGDAIIPIDADLQDDPRIISQMIQKWQEGYKVVLAKRTKRHDPLLKKIMAGLFYKFAPQIMETTMPQNVGDFRLIDQVAVKEIKKMREHNRFMRGILSWTGFKTITIEYERQSRNNGISKYNLTSSAKYALDGIFSFSTFPIRIISYCGFVLSSLSFIYGLIIICGKLFFDIGIPGYASLMSVILFIGGINFIFIGIIGEYVGRIFNEVKNRPLYIVEEINDHHAQKPDTN